MGNLGYLSTEGKRLVFYLYNARVGNDLLVTSTLDLSQFVKKL